MNTAEIKKLLDEKYIGKPFSRYGCGEQVSSWNPACDVKEMVEKLLPKGLTVSAEEDNQHTSLYIYTRSGGKNVRTYIARVGVSKAKGKYHSGYFGSHYYDWTVKGVDVDIYSTKTCYKADISLEQAVEEAVDYIKSQCLNNIAYEKVAKNVYAAIKTLCDTEDYNVSDMISYLYQHKYTLASGD